MIKRFIHFWNGNFTEDERKDAEHKTYAAKKDAEALAAQKRHALEVTKAREAAGYYDAPWYVRYFRLY